MADLSNLSKELSKDFAYCEDAVTGTATAKSYNVPAMQGWICPVCGRGVSPYTAVCPCKNGKEQADEIWRRMR